jgi:hypothetical protein
MALKSWTARYPSLNTHNWVASSNFSKTTFTCTTCGYKVYITNLGFASDYRGKRSSKNVYSFYTCNDVLVKDIIE